MSNKIGFGSVTGFGEPRKPEMNDDTTSGGSSYKTDEFSSLEKVLEEFKRARIFFVNTGTDQAIFLAHIASSERSGDVL